MNETAQIGNQLGLRQLRVQHLMQMYLTSAGLGNSVEAENIKLQVEEELNIYYQTVDKWIVSMRG